MLYPQSVLLIKVKTFYAPVMLIPSGCDFPSSWAELNSGLSLFPQINLLVFVMPCIAVCPIYLKILHTALQAGTVNQLHFIDMETHREEEWSVLYLRGSPNCPLSSPVALL